MMPEDGLDILKGFEAVYRGAVGDPRVADDVTLPGLLLAIKMGFVHHRSSSAYLFRGVDSALGISPEGRHRRRPRVRRRIFNLEAPGRRSPMAIQSGLFTEELRESSNLLLIREAMAVRRLLPSPIERPAVGWFLTEFSGKYLRGIRRSKESGR
jgi:hypothetical protein